MPGLDGTGPRGIGPMTGGSRGFCSPWGISSAPRGYGAYPRTRYGYPHYSGVGVSSPFYGESMMPAQELDFLRNQAQIAKGQLEQIEARIRELEVKEK